MTEDITPIRQQYLNIKKNYPDTIVFFRLGDFYETFDGDAETTSRELDIVLTSRNVAKGMRIPMAGIPYHAVENYLARLIEKGYHVAICEQVGEQPARGLFPRQVVRVVTPGTVVEPGLLKSEQNNYLVAVYIHENKAGIAYTDITTGEFNTGEFTGDDINSLVRGELLRLKPAEILHSDRSVLPEGIQGNISTLPGWRFEKGRCEDTLLRHFQAASLDGFGLRGMPLAVQSAGVILQYVQDTQPSSLKLLTGLKTYSLNEFMTLDTTTIRNLEITETIRYGKVDDSLLSVIDRTLTAMGKRLIRQWLTQPLLNIEKINIRQERVGFLVERGVLRAELRSALKNHGDLERLTNRVISGLAGPRDLAAVKTILENLPKLVEIVQKNPGPLNPIQSDINLCDEELKLIEAAIVEEPPATIQSTGIIKAGFSTELDSVIEASRHAREWISNLENLERERTGIKTLKVGYNKVFGYYIEVTNSNTNGVPVDYIRKQTLVNAERYITPEMKEYETLVLNAEDRIHEIEGRVFKQVCSQIAGSGKKLLDTAHSLAELDVYASLAETAVLKGYCPPEITNSNILDIRDGRHPVVEGSLHGDRFIPNDASFEDNEIVRIITGPNMSGKSTFLRQVALIVLLGQMGSYVPAASATIGLVDRIFTRIGAQDEIHAGQSTFMVEMIETSNILHHATPRSLLILDEIGRGTSTYDGVSIAWAVVEYIHNHPGLRARTIFATHYHELTQLSDLLPGVRNYNVAVTESDGKVVFLHKIVAGGADRSYGIHVAQLAGMPTPLIVRAEEIMHQLESTSGRAVNISPLPAQQMALFPETNPLVEELKAMDVNALSPIEALNRLYEWRKKYTAE